MLRDLLVRASAGLLSAAIAVSCTREESQPREAVGSVQQAATLAGAGGAEADAGGAPADAGGAPSSAGGTPSGLGGAADGGAPTAPVCDPAVCEAPGSCTHCVANQCVRYAANTHVCRPKAGDCDVEEMCTGNSDTCGADARVGIGTECRPKADLCDKAEQCQGGVDCPTDAVLGLGTPCRQKGAGLCDVADTCDGTLKTCEDKKQDPGFICREATAGAPCDEPERCNGGDDCPPPTAVKAAGTLCYTKDPTDPCDADATCTGDSINCPNTNAPDGTSCTSTNKCLVAGTTTCQAGQCSVGLPVTCAPPANGCLDPGVCKPLEGCTYASKQNGTACDDGIACSIGDKCNNGVCQSGTPDENACPQHDCAIVKCDLSATQIPTRCRNEVLPAGSDCGTPVKVSDKCDYDEKCDGVSLDCEPDRVLDAGTPCAPDRCVNFQAFEAQTCNGADKACPVAPASSCHGYACGGDAKCRIDCNTDADCDSQNYYCADHVCEARTGAGQKCQSNSECSKSNPFCVDGVCCNAACGRQCEACDIVGKEGTCSVVTGDPHGDREACNGDGSSCAGTCAGKLSARCEFPPTTTVCVEASCDPATSTALERNYCDGLGNCAKTDPLDCAPFACGATACRGNCVSDAQCVKGSFCKAGVCEELQKPGVACNRDGQCASGFCSDGVCCDGRCDGQCEACSKAGKCEAVTGAPVGKRTACNGADGDDCAGSCDGKLRSGCTYPRGEVTCRDAACESGKATLAARCNGAGACSAERSVACKNGCEGSVCAGDACVVNADCKEGEHCIAGTCAVTGEPGDACGVASDCASGFCVDGVCCDRACDGQCEACDNAKGAGTCSPVSGAPHGDRVQCTTDGSACGGACDGKNADGCSYPSGTSCGDGSCTPAEDGGEAVATVAAQCNGSGRCPAPRQQACGDAGCDADLTQCNGACADGSKCAAGQFCSAGVCVVAQPTGSACQAATDCASGFCVDGYCCGSACDDRCAACDVPGSLGKCSPVTGNTHGGRAGCQGGGVCGARCDGENVTDCAYTEKGISCGAAYCGDGVQVGAQSCDGAGQCREGEQTACPAFACDGAECADGCKTDADCTGTRQCNADGTCSEPFKINAVDEGTCGCRTPGQNRTSHGAAWGALGALALWSLRRRRPRSGRHTEDLP